MRISAADDVSTHAAWMCHQRHSIVRVAREWYFGNADFIHGDVCHVAWVCVRIFGRQYNHSENNQVRSGQVWG